MNKISAFRSGTSILIRYEGSNRTLSHKTEEEAIEAFKTIQQIKADPTEENLAVLRELVDPSYRFSENEAIERDRNGNYYFKGINVPLPLQLYDKLCEYLKDGISIDPLINFWKLLVLNPDRHVRESLFQFAAHFGFPITDMGYFIAYKSVYFAGKKHENMGIKVASKYVYLRAEGKNPADYSLYMYMEGNSKRYEIIHKDEAEEWLKGFSEDMEELVTLKELLAMTPEEREALTYSEEEDAYYRVTTETKEVTLISTLEEAFQNIPSLFDSENENAFTDCHTKSMDIRIGSPVRMKREDCDNNPNQTCSKGLHVGTPQYVKDFGSSSRYILACLVNPMNVVAVPYDYDGQKMRTCEYLPYAVCEIEEDGSLREIDAKYFEEDYIGYEVEELEKMLEEVNERPEDLSTFEERKQQIRNRLIQIS